MKRNTLLILFFVVTAIIAVSGELLKRTQVFCAVDGSRIESGTQVAVQLKDGNELIFCSTCCAKTWLTENREQMASFTVTDETSGKKIDGSLAFWVESEYPSRLENQCRVHVFKDVDEAARHIYRYKGREAPGYLAGFGKKLPWADNFSAADTAGELHKLGDYQDRIVFLRFWNTANPNTLQDLQYLAEAYSIWHDRGLIILAVNVEESPDRVAQFISTLDLPYPVLLDPEGKIADAYKIVGFPTGFLLDRSGIIRERLIGEVSPELMQPLFNSLL